VENAAAAAVKLTNDEVAAITGIAKNADLSGGQYADSMAQLVNRESPALNK
jgi:hypothetical protein